MHLVAQSVGKRYFQYPPGGSRRCNTQRNRLYRSFRKTFSTLQAGRDAATPLLFTCKLACEDLSVPSRRVETLQHDYRDRPSSHQLHFQYPPGGSRRCTTGSKKLICPWSPIGGMHGSNV